MFCKKEIAIINNPPVYKDMTPNRITYIPMLVIVLRQQAITERVIYKLAFEITKQQESMHKLKYLMTFYKRINVALHTVLLYVD